LLLWALFAAFVLQPGWAALGWLAGVLAVRALCLCGLQRSLTGGVRHTPILSVVSELLQPLHLLHASVQRTIIWRKRRYRVHHNDDFHDA
jgi:ceramide glucosyltransferase